MLLWIVAVFCLSIYSIPLFYVAFKWHQYPVYKNKRFSSALLDKILITVIIAVRNEEKNIKNLILALAKQTFPHEKFEVIFVDDNSTDNTSQILQEFLQEYNWLKVLKQQNDSFGKKAAINLGLNHANAELIAYTDGDTLPGRKWLESLWSYYISEKEPDIIIGLVDMTAYSILQQLFRFEFLSIHMVSSAMAAAGIPVLCNGANLAVKKETALKLSLNEKIPSGDDIFLLHAVKKRGGKIAILKSQDHKVHTPAPEGLSRFIMQRIRWGSKARYYTDPSSIMLTLTVVFANIILLISLINSIFNGDYLIFLSCLAVKSISDIAILLSDRRIFAPGKFIFLLPILEIGYSIYLVSAALLSIKNPFEWKGRRYNR